MVLLDFFGFFVSFSCPLCVRSVGPTHCEVLQLRLVSQRQAARPFGPCEIENAVERRNRDPGGLRRLGPWLPQGSAVNRLLHCDRQHAPPATRPA